MAIWPQSTKTSPEETCSCYRQGWVGVSTGQGRDTKTEGKGRTGLGAERLPTSSQPREGSDLYRRIGASQRNAQHSSCPCPRAPEPGGVGGRWGQTGLGQEGSDLCVGQATASGSWGSAWVSVIFSCWCILEEWNCVLRSFHLLLLLTLGWMRQTENLWGDVSLHQILSRLTHSLHQHWSCDKDHSLWLRIPRASQPLNASSLRRTGQRRELVILSALVPFSDGIEWRWLEALIAVGLWLTFWVSFDVFSASSDGIVFPVQWFYHARQSLRLFTIKKNHTGAGHVYRCRAHKRISFISEMSHLQGGAEAPRYCFSWSLCCCSVAKSCPTLCDSMDCRMPGFPVLHYLPVCSDSFPLGWWRYLTICSSATSFSFCPQSFPASGSFPMSWLFALGGQSIGALASASADL